MQHLATSTGSRRPATTKRFIEQEIYILEKGKDKGALSAKPLEAMNAIIVGWVGINNTENFSGWMSQRCNVKHEQDL